MPLLSLLSSLSTVQAGYCNLCHFPKGTATLYMGSREGGGEEVEVSCTTGRVEQFCVNTGSRGGCVAGH